MREAFLRKRGGIPAAFLIVLLLIGTALAWYSFATIDSEATVQEPLLTTETKEFSESMYPGQTNTWTFDIVNSANVAYTIKADLTYSAPDGVSITSFMVGVIDETSDLTEDNSAKFSILPGGSPGGSLSCSVTITADKDAAPGDVSASLDLSRE